MSSTDTTLSYAMAETLGVLVNGFWESFGQNQPFSGPGNLNRGHRGTMLTLIRRGLVVKIDGKVGFDLETGEPFDLYEVTPAARDAYLAWAALHEDDDEDLR